MDGTRQRNVTRRNFLKSSAVAGASSLALPSFFLRVFCLLALLWLDSCSIDKSFSALLD